MGVMRRITGSASRSGIVQTRLGVCLTALAIAGLTEALQKPVFQNSRLVTLVLVTYLSGTILFARVWPATLLARKRFRAIPLGFDVTAIGLLEASGTGIEKSLYVLYLFP